jgi:hypothetical protein
MKKEKLTYIDKKFSSPVHNQRTSLLSHKYYNKGSQLNHSNLINHLEYVFITKKERQQLEVRDDLPPL